MAPKRWLTDDEQVSWRAFLRGTALLLERLDAELIEAHGLTGSDYEILVALSEAPRGGVRMAELAERALVSKSRLTYRVDRLVAEGLVERRPCPSDRRGSLAALTPTGRRKLERAAATHVDGVLAHLVERASARDFAVLGRVFGSVAEALDAHAADADLDCGTR
ncbi:MAG TPA: MarR family transcriptional regulator [Acidimicrobiia bacterium]|jgi:DNA-binding MarR family transcriptional regulator|nr:MarR family transcriptional regulator [Acidimicrobiia bacterium]